MKLGILLQEAELITGTHCANCKFTTGKVVKPEPDEVNPQGGINPQDDAGLKRAAAADLITMPGKQKVSSKIMCGHPKVKLWVNSRMCCAFWDAPGTYRSYGDQEIGK